MNLFRQFRDIVVAEADAMAAAGDLPAGLDSGRIALDPPRDPAHGDMATNAAMVLAGPARQPPRDIAAALAARLAARPGIAAAEVAGPGFVNLRLAPQVWQGALADMLRAGTGYGASDIGRGRRINVEYVSTNPTGPLHVGHARGSVVGDALAALLTLCGYKVTREYYINDAGAQVDALARSLHLRYREALGESIGAFPEGLYPGDYLKPVGEALAARDGGRWRAAPEAEWLPELRRFAVDALMALIRADLALLDVRHDVFTSEARLVEAGMVDAVCADLEARGLAYTGVPEPPKGRTPADWEPRPQLLFRSTRFGDDVDRPLRKPDGDWTYFATDLAFHLDKYRRGFVEMIDVWGADHGGYVKRMQAGIAALTDGRGALDVRLCRMVRLLDGGQAVKMSKRGGTFETVRDLVDSVGAGAVRFIMLTRRNDAPLDFDIAAARAQNRDNPVFYVQYAHARCCSVLRYAAEEFPRTDLAPAALADADLARLTDSGELTLIRTLAAWPRTVESAAEAREPHRVAFSLAETAAAFHALWTRGKDDAGLRFLVADDPSLTRARLALVRATAIVIAAGLGVMGVAPLEELRE